jgi:hypothetical protein
MDKLNNSCFYCLPHPKRKTLQRWCSFDLILTFVGVLWWHIFKNAHYWCIHTWC